MMPIATASRYVKSDADLMINISGSKKKLIEDRIAEGDFCPDMYADAQAEIFKLMDRDNFSRYKKSKHFAQLRDEMNFYAEVSTKKVGSPEEQKRSFLRRWTFNDPDSTPTLPEDVKPGVPAMVVDGDAKARVALAAVTTADEAVVA